MQRITQTEFQADAGLTLTPEQWSRVQGLLRRAERELTLLVGDLAGHDGELIKDTLVDAVREDAINPDRYQSETDDAYSYRRYDLPDGTPGRFWWPANVLELFGIKRPGGRLSVVRLHPSPRGWA
ncbi:hypothetical protein [Janibacter terrae]|uniref:hypothetical protein n=1 Tax=Janibacter terrae TaxID=103817 RepID=UPI0031F7A08F